VREVCEVLFSHRNEVIKWPDNPEKLAEKFYKLRKIPCVAGVIDGAHVPVHPPADDEASFLNKKQGHSINCLAVSGKGIVKGIVSRDVVVCFLLLSFFRSEVETKFFLPLQKPFR
jgi:hypothetical protein